MNALGNSVDCRRVIFTPPWAQKKYPHFVGQVVNYSPNISKIAKRQQT